MQTGRRRVMGLPEEIERRETRLAAMKQDEIKMRRDLAELRYLIMDEEKHLAWLKRPR
jgi:hypothetical protein